MTSRFLEPVLDQLMAALWDLRHGIDGDVEAGRLRLPPRGSKYPKGYCMEITNSAYARLPGFLAAQDGAVAAALGAFKAGGGILKPVWGDLRGRYFQNAIQAGALYVDVANDTVDTTKPKVEILPLAESGFRTVESIEHFLEIARTYWTGQFFPNTVFPRLAPVLPIIHTNPTGKVALKSGLSPIFGANFLSQCQPALAYLTRAKSEEPVAPPAVVEACIERMGMDGWLTDPCRTPDWERLQTCFEEARDPAGPYWAPSSFAALIRTVERVVVFR